MECLYSEDYMGKFSDRAGKIVKSVVEPSISFRCPVHYCSQCYMTDTPLKKAKTFCCVVCCRTVHFKCIDKLVFVRLKTNVFICRVHLTEE